MSSLSVAQVKAILKACSESGVTSLKWGDLQVEFGPKSPAQEQVSDLPLPVAAEIAAFQEKEAEKALLRDEIAHREQQIAMAVLEDPTLGEEMLIQGELDDDGSAEEDET